MKISIKIGIFFCGLLLLFAQSEAKISKRPLAQRLRSAVLQNTEGKSDSLTSIAKHKATVFVFLSSECPISNSYMPLLSELAAKFAASDIAFYGVISDPDATADDAKKFAADYTFPADMLMDSKQELASILNAQITPEVFIISREGKLLYQGRIDDRYVALGKSRVQAQHNDLQDALTNISVDKKPEHSKTKVIGCSIPKAGE
jgi:thiol-disulfide isomerase/thioredoxin